MRKPLLLLLALALLLGACAAPAEIPPPPSAPAETSAPTPAEAPTPALPAETPTPAPLKNLVHDDDWLFASGNKIVDKDGREVWLTGLNWFGYNTERLIFDGSWGMDMRAAAFDIAEHGFNIIRVPMAMTLVRKWIRGEYPVYATVDTTKNPKFTEGGTLAYLDYFIEQCGEAGVKIMLDMHSVRDKTGAHSLAVWYDAGFTTEEYYETLAFLAERYKDNDTVVAFDLKNEPHGGPAATERAVWNASENEDENWKFVAEQAAKRVLAVNPNVLIVIEGVEAYPKDPAANAAYASANGDDYHWTWWGGNLRGVRDFPINLGEFQNKVVYSPHDYGPSVSDKPWFHPSITYERLRAEAWEPNWLFIHSEGIAPLIIGEWGGPLREPTLTWMAALRTLIVEERISHTFWCLNPNSGDTGGLLLDDWATWDEAKYEFLKPALWQKDGRFVGLDAEVPLGRSGLTRTEFYR